MTGNVESTLGRFLFNEILPQDLGYVDRTNPEDLLKLEVDFHVGKKQHHRMLFDHFLQHIPHLGIQPLHQLLGILDILGNASGHQFFHHKRLKQLDRHLLGQTALSADSFCFLRTTC